MMMEHKKKKGIRMITEMDVVTSLVYEMETQIWTDDNGRDKLWIGTG